MYLTAKMISLPFFDVLDTIGNTITGAGKEVKNAFGNMTAAIAGAVKAPFSFMIGLSNNVAHIIVYAGIGVGVLVLVIVGVYVFSHSEKRGKSGKGRKSGHRKK